MDFIYNKIFLEHDTGEHPENRKRLELFSEIKETRVESGEAYLGLFHTEDYIKSVREGCKTLSFLDPDTAVSEKSYEVAVYAVGATIMASKTNDFALVRPPGHHAHPSYSSGFCIFNNISIATKKLVNEGKRVLIFDFDAHLGDGTLEFFYRDDMVLYLSLHQYPAFPGGGVVDDIGEGSGRGYTINVPLPAGSGDDVYMDAVGRIMPIAKQFKPDVVAVSAGFDAHKNDPLVDLRLSMGAYYKLGRIVSKNFRNIFATLEGGYNLRVFPYCVLNFVDGINNRGIRFKEEQTVSSKWVKEEYLTRINRLEKKMSEFWKL